MQRVVVLLVVLAAAAGVARAQQRQSLGTWRGRVKMTSSVVIPGFVPREREGVLELKLVRDGSNVHVTSTASGAVSGRSLTVTATGAIAREQPGRELEIHFGGPAYVQGVESQLNQALQGVSLVGGVHIPLTSASGVSRLTFLGGNKLRLDSTTKVKRGGLSGLRGRMLSLTLPEEIENGFTGELDLVP